MIRRSAVGARRGFTLVELLIVILLIAILMAIVIPQFFGARQKAGDRVAQDTLRQAVSTAKQFSQDNESYETADKDALGQSEPNITFVAATDASANAKTTTRTGADGSGSKGDVKGNTRSVSVLPSGQDMTMAALGENGACWFVRLHYGADATTHKSQPDQYGVQMNIPAGGCTATAMSTATGSNVTVQPQEFPGRS
jgi:prepilin-type N-terminal cleavage/methylation domain-containing protein